uniref:G-protein alpha subunit n=1 Tax=Meloidogyne hapla TaxID=6305 RepID=A0A1I8AW46_MELHA
MGSSLCKGEKVYDEQMDKNRQIEVELHRDRLEERKVVKILLLGSGDSGKSTIVKQMR